MQRNYVLNISEILLGSLTMREFFFGLNDILIDKEKNYETISKYISEDYSGDHIYYNNKFREGYTFVVESNSRKSYITISMERLIFCFLSKQKEQTIDFVYAYAAMLSGNLQVVKFVLNYNRFEKNIMALCIVSIACIRNNLDTIKQLLEHCFITSSMIPTCCMIIAINHTKLDIIEYLLKFHSHCEFHKNAYILKIAKEHRCLLILDLIKNTIPEKEFHFSLSNFYTKILY